MPSHRAIVVDSNHYHHPHCHDYAFHSAESQGGREGLASGTRTPAYNLKGTEDDSETETERATPIILTMIDTMGSPGSPTGKRHSLAGISVKKGAAGGGGFAGIGGHHHLHGGSKQPISKLLTAGRRLSIDLFSSSHENRDNRSSTTSSSQSTCITSRRRPSEEPQLASAPLERRCTARTSRTDTFSIHYVANPHDEGRSILSVPNHSSFSSKTQSFVMEHPPDILTSMPNAGVQMASPRTTASERGFLASPSPLPGQSEDRSMSVTGTADAQRENPPRKGRNVLQKVRSMILRQKDQSTTHLGQSFQASSQHQVPQMTGVITNTTVAGCGGVAACQRSPTTFIQESISAFANRGRASPGQTLRHQSYDGPSTVRSTLSSSTTASAAPMGQGLGRSSTVVTSPPEDRRRASADVTGGQRRSASGSVSSSILAGGTHRWDSALSIRGPSSRSASKDNESRVFTNLSTPAHGDHAPSVTTTSIPSPSSPGKEAMGSSRLKRVVKGWFKAQDRKDVGSKKSSGTEIHQVRGTAGNHGKEAASARSVPSAVSAGLTPSSSMPVLHHGNHYPYSFKKPFNANIAIPTGQPLSPRPMNPGWSIAEECEELNLSSQSLEPSSKSLSNSTPSLVNEKCAEVSLPSHPNRPSVLDVFNVDPAMMGPHAVAPWDLKKQHAAHQEQKPSPVSSIPSSPARGMETMPMRGSWGSRSLGCLVIDRPALGTIVEERSRDPSSSKKAPSPCHREAHRHHNASAAHAQHSPDTYYPAPPGFPLKKKQLSYDYASFDRDPVARHFLRQSEIHALRLSGVRQGVPSEKMAKDLLEDVVGDQLMRMRKVKAILEKGGGIKKREAKGSSTATGGKTGGGAGSSAASGGSGAGGNASKGSSALVKSKSSGQVSRAFGSSGISGRGGSAGGMPPPLPTSVTLPTSQCATPNNTPTKPSTPATYSTVSQKYLSKYQLHPLFLKKYRLLDELGSGGFGFVLTALQLATNEEVAVKFIFSHKVPRHSWTRDPELGGLVPMEVKILKEVRHKNVVRFVECFRDDVFWVLVMELHGESWCASPGEAEAMPAVKLPELPQRAEPSKQDSGSGVSFLSDAKLAGNIAATSGNVVPTTGRDLGPEECLPKNSSPPPSDVAQPPITAVSSAPQLPSTSCGPSGSPTLSKTGVLSTASSAHTLTEELGATAPSAQAVHDSSASRLVQEKKGIPPSGDLNAPPSSPTREPPVNGRVGAQRKSRGGAPRVHQTAKSAALICATHRRLKKAEPKLLTRPSMSGTPTNRTEPPPAPPSSPTRKPMKKAVSAEIRSSHKTSLKSRQVGSSPSINTAVKRSTTPSSSCTARTEPPSTLPSTRDSKERKREVPQAPPPSPVVAGARRTAVVTKGGKYASVSAGTRRAGVVQAPSSVSKTLTAASSLKRGSAPDRLPKPNPAATGRPPKALTGISVRTAPVGTTAAGVRTGGARLTGKRVGNSVVRSLPAPSEGKGAGGTKVRAGTPVPQAARVGPTAVKHKVASGLSKSSLQSRTEISLKASASTSGRSSPAGARASLASGTVKKSSSSSLPSSASAESVRRRANATPVLKKRGNVPTPRVEAGKAESNEKASSSDRGAGTESGPAVRNDDQMKNANGEKDQQLPSSQAEPEAAVTKVNEGDVRPTPPIRTVKSLPRRPPGQGSVTPSKQALELAGACKTRPVMPGTPVSKSVPTAAVDKRNHNLTLSEGRSESKVSHEQSQSTGTPAKGELDVNPTVTDRGNKAAAGTPVTTCSTLQMASSIGKRNSMDLFECIEQHSKLSEPVSRKIFRQIADAVHYLHHKNILHRDLKDENIVVDRGFNVKLIDFGSSAFIPKDGEYFRRFAGTAQYASPQILKGEQYKGPEQEIWSLGILLYTMLSGGSPFQDPGQVFAHEKTGGANLRRPVTVCDNGARGRVSDECWDLILSMLRPAVAERITIDEVVEHPWLSYPGF